MGRAGRPLPPGLQELRAEGLPDDWSQYWHGQRGEEAGSYPSWSGDSKILKNPLLETLSDLKDRKKLPSIWDRWNDGLLNETVPTHLFPMTLGWPKEEWAQDALSRMNWPVPVAPLLPGTFIALPNKDADTLKDLQEWMQNEPDSFQQFFRKEILPGISGITPTGPDETFSEELGALWGGLIQMEAPELMPLMQRIEEEDLTGLPARARFVFAWHTLSALREGASYEEAGKHAAKQSFVQMLNYLQRDNAAHETLRRLYPACSNLLSSFPINTRNKLLRDDDAWQRFTEGQYSFEDVLVHVLSSDK